MHIKEPKKSKAVGVVKRRVLVWMAHIAIFVLSGVGAFLLRFDLNVPSRFRLYLMLALPVWIVVKVCVFFTAKLYRGLWLYVSLDDLARLGIANVSASLLSCVIISYTLPSGFPRSIYLLDLMICFLGTSGMRLMVRITKEATSNGQGRGEFDKRTFIYGAGHSGITLLKEIRKNSKLQYRVVGFLDDQADKWGLRVAGVAILGGGSEAQALVEKHRVEAILIAIPSASGVEMTRILDLCHAAGAECKTVPGLTEVIEGSTVAGQIRDVAVEDLLGRTPVQLEESQILDQIEGEVVLVTGAAGSIGSELCRQIACFRPAGIVGYEIAESPLFEIDREMRKAFPNVPFYPEIGSIQNRSRLDDVMRHYRPSVVYHAAAYKHVPLMETHVFEAVENNVFGTYNIAMASSRWGVKDFVMISSDKLSDLQTLWVRRNALQNLSFLRCGPEQRSTWPFVLAMYLAPMAA